ncbi:CNNM domain-containing protein [Poriferisphaera sp. WC338]|uniref:CNNM domain-containing protein n=1 Tax=Poriferisphaera sp. WC338 TaxID=3425129 RepID=UPI003D817C35
MTADLVIWFVFMFIGFLGSALYSGMETGAYRLNRVRLHINMQKGSKPATTLYKLLRKETNLLSTLLIGNNITNQLGTASLAVLLSIWQFDQWQSIILNTIIVTPILFIFGETLPKDLFAAHAELLMYRLARILLWSKRVFTWIGFVPLIGICTRALMRIIGSKNTGQGYNPRNQVQWLVNESVGYGLISDDQSQMVARVLAMNEITVTQEMIPWDKVIKVKETDQPQILWKLAEKYRGSRYPVTNAHGNVIGIIQVNDGLIHDQATCPSIKQLMKPVCNLQSNLPIREALRTLQKDHVYMGIVQNPQEQPIGIVTIKDLIEPITGDLIAF